jgi:hypothetical protein
MGPGACGQSDEEWSTMGIMDMTGMEHYQITVIDGEIKLGIIIQRMCRNAGNT